MGGDMDLTDRAVALLSELAIAQPAGVIAVQALKGGVASDIAVATLADGRRICVKFALARLRVAEEWRAPVHRNRSEYAWLQAAATLAPGHVPRLYGWSRNANGFAMEYIAGTGVTLWKTALLDGAPEAGETAAVGDVLGRIHAGSTAPGFDQRPFANGDDFRALRIEPYLTFTAGRHPSVAARITALATALDAASSVLVHGDVSPKNILLRAGQPVLLDAECASMGDPAFDVAFCLTHLVLKAIHRPDRAPDRRRGAAAMWRAYAAHVAWEHPDAVAGRVAALLPALLLARVDGKSPVEYLSAANQSLVRSRALDLLAGPAPDLYQILSEFGARP